MFLYSFRKTLIENVIPGKQYKLLNATSNSTFGIELQADSAVRIFLLRSYIHVHKLLDTHTHGEKMYINVNNTNIKELCEYIS